MGIMMKSVITLLLYCQFHILITANMSDFCVVQNVTLIQEIPVGVQIKNWTIVHESLEFPMFIPVLICIDESIPASG